MENVKGFKEVEEAKKGKISSESDILKAHIKENVAGASGDAKSGDAALLHEIAYKLDNERIRRGAEKFQELLDAVEDEGMKSLLSRGQDGRELQAIYIGIKPYGNFVSAFGKPLLPLEKIKEHLVDDLAVAENGSVFDGNLTERVLKNQKDSFADYDGSSVEPYIEKRSSPYIPDDADRRLIEQNGLLFGFPPPEAKKYAQFAESWSKITNDMQFYIDDEDPEAQRVFSEFMNSGRLDASFKAENRQILS